MKSSFVFKKKCKVLIYYKLRHPFSTPIRSIKMEVSQFFFKKKSLETSQAHDWCPYNLIMSKVT